MLIPITLEELDEKLKNKDIIVRRRKNYAVIADSLSVALATENGVFKIPLVEAPDVLRDLSSAVIESLEKTKNFPLETKNEIAKAAGLTYGRYMSEIHAAETRLENEKNSLQF